jgi:hypothetical protein
MRRLTHLAAMLLATAALACGGDSTSPTASIAGTWKLQTENGSPLPYLEYSGGGSTMERLEETLIMTAANSSGGSWTTSDSIRYTLNGHVTILTGADSGTYSLNRTVGSLAFSHILATASLSWSGNSLTLTSQDGATVTVWRR